MRHKGATFSVTWDMEPKTMVRSFIMGISKASSMLQTYTNNKIIRTIKLKIITRNNIKINKN